MEREDNKSSETESIISFNSLLTYDVIVIAMSSILNEIIEENTENETKSEIIKEQKFSPFFTQNAPSILIKAYIERIVKYTKIEENTLIISLIFIDKLCENSHFILTSNNVHR